MVSKDGLNPCHVTFKSNNGLPWLCYAQSGFMITASQASWVSKSPASALVLAETPLLKLMQ